MKLKMLLLVLGIGLASGSRDVESYSCDLRRRRRIRRFLLRVRRVQQDRDMYFACDGALEVPRRLKPSGLFF